MDILKNIKYKQIYCSSIHDSKYIQSSTTVTNVYDLNNSYKTLEELIIYTYNYNSILNDNTKLYIDKCKLKLATDIEENKEKYYYKYNYSKKMKINLIQNGLQKSDTLSTIIYMSDIYSIDILIKINDNYYKLTDKNSDIFFVEYSDNLWRNIKECKYETIQSNDNLKDIIDFNINLSDIYNKYLKAISNYKIQDLITIAQELNIDISKNNKKKLKKELYDEINMLNIGLEIHYLNYLE